MWIFGDAPAWVSRPNVRVVHSPQQNSAYASTRTHLRRAIEDDRVSDPFALWNDDFYAMRPVWLVPMHQGPMSALLLKERRGETRWVKGLRETLDLLRAHGYDEPLSYDVHTPLLIRKDAAREALKMAAQVKEDAVHVRSIYAALAGLNGLNGLQIKDPKMHHRLDPFPTGAWLSSSAATFRLTVEPVLRYTFPHRSIYEKEMS